MINQVVYDVFIKNEEDDKNAQGLRGCSRFNEDLKSFTEKGLEFRYDLCPCEEATDRAVD